jgi:hypothetical protein
MAHESGKGAAVSGNNPGGVMDPATNWRRRMQFAGLDDGISKTAQVLSKNYGRAGGDMRKLADIYAPQGAANDPNGLNKHWLSGVSKYTGEMSGGTKNLAAAGVGQGLADKLGIRGKANLMSSSGLRFGGPGQNLTTITTASGKKLTVNEAAAASFRGFVDELEASGYKIKSLAGYSHRNKVGGGGWSEHAFGNAIDINPSQNPYSRKFITDLPSNVSDMAAKYGLSWGGDWKSIKDTMHFEWTGKKPWLENPAAVSGVTDKVAPSQMIQNVPPPAAIRGDASMGLMRGSGGPVAIHIDGSSHDPEALATLVQRRIDESMNWRTHDTSSEYT